ncbi:thiolase domain-containing protein [bacterium]|nr:thiolase domain-containing protein [bacterium]MBU1916789.1 thiolase domain-containing protein [bacterium]
MTKMNKRVACIGAGMTRFVRRAQESTGELASLAVEMALKDAGLTMNDIDSVCLGTAPDAFDGIHMKGENLIAGSGGANKPYMRHFVGGGTGVFSPIHGWMHVASGQFKTCLVVTEEKMSPCNPHPAGAFKTIFDHTTEQPLDLTLIHIFAIEMARFMHKYGYKEEELALISVQNKLNAMDHPAAQIAQQITVDDVMNSKLLSWPVKRLDISPTSDAAVAIVLSNEDVARAQTKHPVFIEGVGYRLDTAYWCTRDLAYPDYVELAARDAYKMAGITSPEQEIDIFEPYDPFDYKALHHMNGLLLDKSGKKVKELLFSGSFARDGSHPLCPSGGALGVGNPIAATGLMKIAELYFQLSGQAGKRQVKKDCRRGVAQAWGDLMQVGTVVVMGNDEAVRGRKTFWSEAVPEQLPGTAIKNPQDVPHMSYTPDLRYSWDNGYALTTYLDGFKNGKIRGSKCSSCGRMMIPARSFCELCNLKAVEDYYDLPDSGTIETFTLSHVDWDSSMLPDGQINMFAVISIDGAAKKMGLVHRLGDVDPKDVKIGMRVKAVWKPENEREGNVLDLKYFRPLKDGEAIGEPKRIKPVEMDSTTAKAFPGQIPMSYIYTAGIAGAKFYNDFAQGRVSGTWCEHCQKVHLPTASFCEYSLKKLDPTKDAREIDAKSGVIASYTVVHDDRSGHQMDKPQVVVQISYPEAVGTIFGKLETSDVTAVKAGMNVELIPSRTVGEGLMFKTC